jgi:hypothetical protein
MGEDSPANLHPFDLVAGTLPPKTLLVLSLLSAVSPFEPPSASEHLEMLPEPHRPDMCMHSAGVSECQQFNFPLAT